MATDDQDTHQSETNPGESDVNSPDGGDKESPDQNSTPDNSLSLEQLEDVLGKNFKDRESALKSLKDTQDYVGGLGSKVSQYEEKYGKLEQDEADESESSDKKVDDNVMTKEDYKREKFFDENETYANHRDVIEALSEKHDVTVQEVVEMDKVKSLFESQKELDDVKSQQSVAMSNNRTAQESDAMDEARKEVNKASDARMKGDTSAAQRHQQNAQQNAVKAVVDSIGDK